nr:RNA-binding protein 7 isoform X4 [Solanum lycopersicum]
MAENPNCTVYVGNLDERVCDRVLYDILIQAGRVVDLYIPRDKETDKPKGFAFAKYETEEIADYAVKLFSGLVTLYNRTLKFAISGQDKPYNNSPIATLPALNIPSRPRPDKEISPNSARLSTSCLFSQHQTSYAQASHHHYKHSHKDMKLWMTYSAYKASKQVLILREFIVDVGEIR